MALSRFHALLETKLEEEVKKVGEQIAAGSAQSYDSYRESVGYIRGLIAASKLADDTEVEMGE